MKKITKYKVFWILPVVVAAVLLFTQVDYGQDAMRSTKITENTPPVVKIESGTEYERVSLELENVDDIDGQIEDYLEQLYPIIHDDDIEAIQGTKEITKKLVNDTLGHVDFYLSFNVPKHFLEPNPVMLWELNLPEFKSRIYQVYNNDTILITIWPNVVGKPSTKTYTGHYNIFRLRNWPSWKDPDSDPSEPATPPGPGNPLGLFAAHYDENSLRYFHGTNHNNLLSNEYRALSHGCVRNDNDNIRKMKNFIVTHMVTSTDLSFWANSKKSMMYNFTEEEKSRFPVRIMYKTYRMGSDDNGDYIEFFADIYGYGKGAKWSKFDDESLMVFPTVENIKAEYKASHKPNQFQLTDDKLIPIIERIISNHKDRQRYYFDDLVKTGTETGN